MYALIESNQYTHKTQMTMNKYYQKIKTLCLSLKFLVHMHFHSDSKVVMVGGRVILKLSEAVY